MATSELTSFVSAFLRRSGFENAPVEPEGVESAYSLEPDHEFTPEELWPELVAACQEFGFYPEIVAGMIQQESTWHNYRVHRDGHGHGLLGLDDNGLLRDFEPWAGIEVGRGEHAIIIPVEPQLRFAAYQLRRYMDAYPDVMADPYIACGAWHRSGAQRNSPEAVAYQKLIQKHVQERFS